MDAPTPVPEPLEILTIDRPEQIKALGHPLRLRVLELLGETGEELSNRELASRLEVDPGHLRSVAGAGRAREKPYRAIAKAIRVAPELLGTGSTDIHAAMLEEVQRGWEKYGPEGRFRSAQLTARLKPEHVRELWQAFVAKAEELEDPDVDPVLVTLVSHPYTAGE